MPLPSDEKLVKLSEDLVKAFATVFGDHPGYRKAHAKGVLINGTFTASEAAKTLSKAPQFNKPTTPITVRFSSSTGIPQIPDTDPNGNPRGFAIRFVLGEHKHTDIVTHSTPFFPTRTGEEFLEFLQAVAASSAPDAGSPSPVEKFVGSHPSTLAFVTAPKPFPLSFATEAYYGVTSLKFINAEGKTSYVRYRVVPEAEVATLDDAALKKKGPNYLYDELPSRLSSGPVTFKLLAQVAEEGDAVNDATIHWPESRKIVELGVLKLESVAEDNAKEQKQIIFDPIPRIDGIEPSDDPLLELRAAVYLISGRQRRAA